VCYTKWGCCTTEAVGALHRKCKLEPHFIGAALEGTGESVEPEIGSVHSNAENSVMTFGGGA
jgi:hypothetical protein